MSKSVSVKDIAKKLNISLSTVHKALTGKPGVGEERRRQVLETAHEMGYTVNPVAQCLSRKDMKIGIFMPSQWQEYFGSMRDGMKKELEELEKYKVKGYFYDISSDFSESGAGCALEWLSQNAVDALIYCPSMYDLNEAFVSAVKKSGIPVFLAGDGVCELESVSKIETDAVLAAKLAADFLRCVHPDGAKAAVFTGTLRIKNHREKAEAFTERLESFGGKVLHVCETYEDEKKIYDYIKEIAEAGDINSVYAATATSLPICRFIEENGLENKISLVCTDIFEELRYYMKKGIVKASVFQNQEKVGKHSVRSVYNYLVAKNSYSGKTTESAGTVYVRPSLLLLADVE